METLRALYHNLFYLYPTDIIPLTAAGSNRRYYRLTGPQTLVGVHGESVAENRAFIYLSRHFRSVGIHVPAIVGVSTDGLCYLQEDLGSTSLFDAIESGRTTGQFSEHEYLLLSRTIRALPDIQFRGGRSLNYKNCYPQAAFDRRTVMWDLNYFKYCFLLTTGLHLREDLLEDDFCRLADLLLGDDDRHATFMYRDFQSRNVMIGNDDEPWFIDYQGGRRGPYLYDVASFLWQARANLSDELRTRLLAEYVDALRTYLPDASIDDIAPRLHRFVLLRILQTLGAYGFRGRVEGKPHFLQSIPAALRNLKKLLAAHGDDTPYLREITRSVNC